jgi:hypothetical protein
MRKGQIGMEYIILVGFITFAVMTVLGLAFYYIGTIRDEVKGLQMNGCAKKIISEAEEVFYLGYPSKSTFTCYMPDNVRNISIAEDNLIVTYSTSSGMNILAFSSKVPINGSITSFSGPRKIKVDARQMESFISFA